MDPKVYMPRIIAALIAAGLKYIGLEVGEESGISHEVIDGLSLGIALVGYSILHKLISKRVNPGDVALERRHPATPRATDPDGVQVPPPRDFP